jgi:hypothetical protein
MGQYKNEGKRFTVKKGKYKGKSGKISGTIGIMGKIEVRFDNGMSEIFDNESYLIIEK